MAVFWNVNGDLMSLAF